MTAAALTREIADAGVGLGRLVRYDPRWPEGFDPSASGFLRSFLGPLIGLPFYLFVASVLPTDGPGPMWSAGMSHVLNAVAYPVVVGLLARPFALGAGYAGFIVIVNWASLFLNMGTAAAALLVRLGENGLAAFSYAWLCLFGMSLFITWRAARETLSSEIPPALLMVVLSVAVGVASDQVSDKLVAWLGYVTPVR